MMDDGHGKLDLPAVFDLLEPHVGVLTSLDAMPLSDGSVVWTGIDEGGVPRGVARNGLEDNDDLGHFRPVMVTPP